MLMSGGESKSSSSVDAVLMAALDHAAITERTPKVPSLEGVTGPFRRDEYETRPYTPYDQFDLQTETTAYTKPYSPYEIFEVRDQSMHVPKLEPRAIEAGRNLVADETTDVVEPLDASGPTASTIAFVAFVALTGALVLGVLLVFAIT